MTTLTSPHDLLAAIPFLIGYHPTDSLVLICIKDGSIGMAMRMDYPSSLAPLADAISHEALVNYFHREGADGALIVAYAPKEASDGSALLLEIGAALEKAGICIRESILISQGKWRSLLCHDLLCCPPTGRALPEIDSSRIAAEEVSQGHPMPYLNLLELRESLSPLPLSCDAEFVAKVGAHRMDCQSESLPTLQREGAVAVIDLASRFIAGSVGQDILGDQELSALVLASLVDIQVRDFALGSHDEITLPLYWAMWRYLLRISPAGYVAPVASLLAAVAYEKGEGALAHRALDRAFEDEPQYSLAILLRRVFCAGWPAESFAQMRKELHPKVCAMIFESESKVLP